MTSDCGATMGFLEPLVSVIAVCYNQEKFVLETLESVRSQDYSNIELIFCDDASSDNSASIALNWLSRNAGNAITIVHKNNLGLCPTLNEALRLATGKYLQIIACDDRLRFCAISERVRVLEESDSRTVMCCGNFDRIDSAGMLLHEGAYPPDYRLPDDMFLELVTRKMVFHPATALWKTIAIKEIQGFDESYAAEGFQTWLRLFYHGAKATYLPRCILEYRIDSASFSHSGKYDIRFAEDRLRAMLSFAADGDRLRALKMRCARECLFLVEAYLKTSERLNARNAFARYLEFVEDDRLVQCEVERLAMVEPAFTAEMLSSHGLTTGKPVTDFFVKRKLSAAVWVLSLLARCLRFTRRFLAASFHASHS